MSELDVRDTGFSLCGSDETLGGELCSGEGLLEGKISSGISKDFMSSPGSASTAIRAPTLTALAPSCCCRVI